MYVYIRTHTRTHLTTKALIAQESELNSRLTENLQTDRIPEMFRANNSRRNLPVSISSTLATIPNSSKRILQLHFQVSQGDLIFVQQNSQVAMRVYFVEHSKVTIKPEKMQIGSLILYLMERHGMYGMLQHGTWATAQQRIFESMARPRLHRV